MIMFSSVFMNKMDSSDKRNKKRYSGKSLEAIRLLQRYIMTYHLIGRDRKEVTALHKKYKVFH